MWETQQQVYDTLGTQSLLGPIIGTRLYLEGHRDAAGYQLVLSQNNIIMITITY